MVNISKVESLIREKGWKAPYFCAQMGHARNWIAEWKHGKGLPDQNAINRIAELLDTTSDYLTDKTEDAKKPDTDDGDGLNENEALLMELFRMMSPDQQKTYLTALEAGLKSQGLM